MQEISPVQTTAEEEPAAAPAPSNRAAMLIVFLVVFIDLLGFGIVLPMLPVIGDEYVAAILGGGSKDWRAGAIDGLLMMSFSLMQFLFAPIWGRLSDRVGRRPILLIGLAGSVIFYALFGYACTLSRAEHAVIALLLFFLARIGAGICGATIATAQAVIADCTPPEKRKHGMALIGAAFGIGFTFGPLIGGGSLALFPGHHEAIGFAAALLSGAALVLGIRMLPETRKPQAESSARRKWVDLLALKRAATSTVIGPVILTFFLATLGFASFEVTLGLFLEKVIGFERKDSYLVFAYVGFVLLLTQGVIYRRAATRLAEPTLMAIGIAFMALGLAALAAVTLAAASISSGTILLLAVFAALTWAVVGFAFLTPSAQALISRRSSGEVQGEILGVNQSASAMARILGPLIGLILFKMTDPPLLPYVFGAILVALMLPLLPRISRGGQGNVMQR
jgi:MFS transporter, DHA1 family, tetracycline resistance protein